MTPQATVFVSSTCPYCTMMTSYLDEQNISYETINVSLDPQAGKRLVETTGQMGVPQTKLNDVWILGFDPEGVQKALHGGAQ
ncbi:glutaredoxin family protein [Sporosarcina sp. A2]|uniref:glutaredoxin family protein n=1 Tax=Sporosarcina sp. A2 TaxID=3393449 RepID=UPI003D7A8135